MRTRFFLVVGPILNTPRILLQFHLAHTVENSAVEYLAWEQINRWSSSPAGQYCAQLRISAQWRVNSDRSGRRVQIQGYMTDKQYTAYLLLETE